MENLNNNLENNNEPKVEKLFGNSFEISKLSNNDRIPTGGYLITREHEFFLVADFDNLESFYTLLDKNTETILKIDNLSQLKGWLEELNLKQKIDPEFFAKTYVFTKVYEKTFGKDALEEKKREQKRKELSRGKEEVKLSEVLEEKLPVCTEIAVLAQFYLQNHGVDSKYFDGGIVREKEFEDQDDYVYPTDHAFILINHDGKQYVYDPANPTPSSPGKMPSIFILKADFNNEVREGKKVFVEAENVLGGKKSYYGVFDGTSINRSNIAP